MLCEKGISVYTGPFYNPERRDEKTISGSTIVTNNAGLDVVTFKKK